MYIQNGTGSNANWIQSSIDGTNWEGYLQKTTVVKIAPTFIANVNTVRANRQDRTYWCQVTIFTNDGGKFFFDTQDIANQSGWFNSIWTTAAQFQGGLNQAVTDLQAWVG